MCNRVRIIFHPRMPFFFSSVAVAPHDQILRLLARAEVEVDRVDDVTSLTMGPALAALTRVRHIDEAFAVARVDGLVPAVVSLPAAANDVPVARR